MSNSALLAGSAVTQAFSDLLTHIPGSNSEPKIIAPKLGKTAAAVKALKEEAQRDGYREGFAQGIAEGKNEGYQSAFKEERRKTRTALLAFDEKLEADLDTAMNTWYQSLEAPLAELSVLIATRIIGRELRTDPQTVLDIVKHAMAEVTHANSARIRLNVADRPLVETHKEIVMSVAPSLRTIDLINDPSIKAGCVIETEGGVVDASIDSMIHSALDSLRGEE